MSRKMRHFIAVVVVAMSFGGLNLTTALAGPPTQGPECSDLADHGITGNLGDPGDGQEHHNESNGVGNHGDPGNGAGHYCPNE
ncbi:MAG: hypothetical protein E6G62_06850 [Actinobacteria bacterium]|nr:MAG: hypothetical protein E6G62_06850 [Actinomycetota bacterium]